MKKLKERNVGENDTYIQLSSGSMLNTLFKKFYAEREIGDHI